MTNFFNKRPIRFSLRAALIGLAVASVIFAVARFINQPRQRTERTIPFSQNERDHALWKFSGTVSTLRNFGPFRARYGSGTNAVSWRVAVATKCDCLDPPDYVGNLSWSQNALFDNEFFELFCFDSDNYQEWDRHYTNIVAVTGPGTAWSAAPSGLSTTSLADDTIVLVEVRPSAKIEWLEPRDLDILKMPRRIGDPQGISGTFDWGFMVGFADGQVWVLKPDTPFDALEPFLTVRGAKENDRHALLAPYVVERKVEY